MIPSEIQLTGPGPPLATRPAPADRRGLSFHDILSAMNPLQYLPVVGTLYRAITGDVIPEALRHGGSLLVSGVLGGPVGLITSIAVTIAEKITGIDPEKIAAAQFNTAPSEAAVPPETLAAAPAPTVSEPLALSPMQLAAYGLRSNLSGTPRLGDVEGADVFNMIELVRLGTAAAAYAANQTVPLKDAVHAG
jgi:hypothetical protein